MTAASERLLTLADIQQSANVSRPTVWRWTQERGLKSIRVGRCVRIRERDWLAFLAKHTIQNTNESDAGKTGIDQANAGGQPL